MDDRRIKQWLVYDIGSSGVKAALMRESGEIVRSAVEAYATHTGTNGVVEQNAEDWWQAAITVTRQLAPEKITGIALTGHMQDLILVDADGAPLRPVMLYSDTRARDQIAEIQSRIGADKLRRWTGNDQGADSLLAKCLWIQQHEPDSLNQARYMLLGAADFVGMKLTGIAATDTATASTTGLIALQKREWLSRRVLEEIGIGEVARLLPSLVVGGAHIGALTSQAAEILGLTEGIPVYHAPGDAGATTIGAGSGEIGRAYGYLGTSGWIAFVDSSPGSPDQGVITLAHTRSDQFIPVAPLLTAGGNLDWVCRLFENTEDVGGLIDTALAQPISSLLYLPYLNGERSPFSDPLARAAFIGLNANTNQADMLRAVLEGIAYAYRHALDALLQTPPQTLTLTGGGTRSEGWMQLFSDILNLPVSIGEDAENVAVRGALLSALVAAGVKSDYAPDGYFPIRTTLQPNSNPRYAQKYQIFRAAYPALKPIFTGLATH